MNAHAYGHAWQTSHRVFSLWKVGPDCDTVGPDMHQSSAFHRSLAHARRTTSPASGAGGGRQNLTMQGFHGEFVQK
jgi:hypothetical protein